MDKWKLKVGERYQVAFRDCCINVSLVAILKEFNILDETESTIVYSCVFEPFINCKLWAYKDGRRTNFSLSNNDLGVFIEN